MRLRSSLASQGDNVASRGINQVREQRNLGEVLNLNPAQQDAVAQRQADTGHLFGEAVVELGFATEDQVRKLEVKGFMALLKTDATLARVEHMLETGRPLRN